MPITIVFLVELFAYTIFFLFCWHVFIPDVADLHYCRCSKEKQSADLAFILPKLQVTVIKNQCAFNRHQQAIAAVSLSHCWTWYRNLAFSYLV
jgi:hypothetical protein